MSCRILCRTVLRPERTSGTATGIQAPHPASGVFSIDCPNTVREQSPVWLIQPGLTGPVPSSKQLDRAQHKGKCKGSDRPRLMCPAHEAHSANSSGNSDTGRIGAPVAPLSKLQRNTAFIKLSPRQEPAKTRSPDPRRNLSRTSRCGGRNTATAGLAGFVQPAPLATMLNSLWRTIDKRRAPFFRFLLSGARLHPGAGETLTIPILRCPCSAVPLQQARVCRGAPVGQTDYFSLTSPRDFASQTACSKAESSQAVSQALSPGRRWPTSTSRRACYYSSSIFFPGLVV